MEIFRLEGLSFTYPMSSKPALSNIDLSVSKGDFFVICGHSGCGKTTLLRILKPALTPHGEISGNVLFSENPISDLPKEQAAREIGFVMQSPDSQTVTDKVWHELAFTLENLGVDSDTIRKRTAEMATFFGIETWFYKDIAELSGGQKQLLALASAMIVQPEVLILDEPTSQLDPIAAEEFMSTLSKINRELGTTIILSEHRLEEAFSYANKAAVMENGRILFSAATREVGLFLKENNSPMFTAMPVPMRIWGSVETELACPVTVKEGRDFYSEYTNTHTLKEIHKNKKPSFGKEMIKARDVHFKYEPDGNEVLKGLDLSAHMGELLCILGGNGSGKTTALKLLSGIKKPQSGEIILNGTVGYLPQNVQALFVKKTVIEELYDVLKNKNMPPEQMKRKTEEIASLCGVTDILYCHPNDISGGQQQKAAFAKILLLSPDIILLDEPTKGLDAPYKQKLAELLIKLKNEGKCIIAVSHDVEFCAEYGDTCALLFDGSFTSVSSADSFFSGNSFYTTAANRMVRHMKPDIVTVREAAEAIGGESYSETAVEEKPDYEIILPENKSIKRLSPFRKTGALLSAAAAFAILVFSASNGAVTDFISNGGVSEKGIKQLAFYGAFILTLILLALFLGKGNSSGEVKLKPKKEKLSKRTLLSVAVSVVIVPLTLFSGMYFFDTKQYYLTALIIILECMLPFVLIFEGRKHSTGEIVTIAVLCAIGVAGRAAFFMLPQFKPVAAIVIISGVMLGGEAGFTVGAVTMLVSNMLFSQGPWTPWQMFAMGLIGLIAGLLSKKGLLSKNRTALCIFGVLSTYIIYGGLVNASTALMWGGDGLNMKIFAGYYISGFPLDTVHAASTAIFLWFGAEPLIDILDRVKIKYNI